MSFIQRELDKLNRALDCGAGDPNYLQYYAAQQALAWALDPNCAASPYAMISGNRGDNSVTVEFSDLPSAIQPPQHPYPGSASQ